MGCKTCDHILDAAENGQMYVIRNCAECGRRMKIRQAGDHGIGLVVEKGDEVVVPQAWLQQQLTANPLKGGGRFTRTGIHWFATHMFVGGLEKRRHDFRAAIEEIENVYTDILKKSPLLQGLDVEDPDQSEAVFKKLDASRNSAEFWLYFSALYFSIAKEAIDKDDVLLAAWAAASGERFRSLYIFKEHFEEVVWMGHSAKRLTELLELWYANKTNSDEEFWQIQFQNRSLALSQVFSVPVSLIEGKAYVGGQGIDRKDARFVDFLFSRGTGNEAVLIEIKTPVTQLIQKNSYRSNVYAPTSELTGSVVQVADYKRSLTQEFAILRGKREFETFNPKAVLIIGTATELDTQAKRNSFELFRSSLSGIEVMTFDEVFLKIEHLATLFNLVRKNAEAA
jgi:hypothetical protein